MLPSSIVHFGAERLRLKILPVTLPLRSQPAQIMTLKDRTPNAIAQLFVDELRVVTEPLRKDVGRPKPKKGPPLIEWRPLSDVCFWPKADLSPRLLLRRYLGDKRTSVSDGPTVAVYEYTP